MRRNIKKEVKGAKKQRTDAMMQGKEKEKKKYKTGKKEKNRRGTKNTKKN